MSNPTPDFPSTIHAAVDVGSFSGIKTLGGSVPSQTSLAGKVEEELVVTQTKLGLGDSSPVSGRYLRSGEDGFSSWEQLSASDMHDDFIRPVTINVPNGGLLESSLERFALRLKSSFDGGENTFDSTGRLELESYQRAQHTNPNVYAHYGEVIRIHSRKSASKQMIAWYGPTSYDEDDDPVGDDTAWFWMGAHYEANDHNSVHGHWSLEVPDSNADLQTRLEILIWDHDTGDFGLDKTSIITHDADLINEQSRGKFHLASASGFIDQYFNRDTHGADSGKRWGLQTDNATESGSSVGSDFRINRYDDSGNFVESAFYIKRSSGAIGVGGIVAPAAKIDVIEAGSRHGVQSKVTTSFAVNFAAYAAIIGATGNRILDARITGDGTARYVVFGDGKTEWGDGSSRDVNLFRNAADQLRTDDSLVVGTRLTIGTSLNAAQLYSLSNGTIEAGKFASSADGTANLAVVAINPFSASKRALDIRLAADDVPRIKIDMSAGSGSGTITFGDGVTADVNLYRSAANVLKTDDAFVAAGGLTIASLSGLLKAASGVVSAATSGTDYAPATSGSSILKGNGSGGFSSAVAGTDYQGVVKQGLAKVSGGATQYGIPGITFISTASSTMTPGQVRYIPFTVKYPITVTALQFEVTTAPASSANVRVGIYLADGELQPTGAPLYDAGVAVASGFTGLKSTTGLSVALTPGTYLVALNVDVSMLLRTVTSGAPTVSANIGTNAVISRYTATQTYGAFPNPGTKWTTAFENTGGLQNSVFLQWTE